MISLLLDFLQRFSRLRHFWGRGHFVLPVRPPTLMAPLCGLGQGQYWLGCRHFRLVWDPETLVCGMTHACAVRCALPTLQHGIAGFTDHSHHFTSAVLHDATVCCHCKALTASMRAVPGFRLNCTILQLFAQRVNRVLQFVGKQQGHIALQNVSYVD